MSFKLISKKEVIEPLIKNNILLNAKSNSKLFFKCVKCGEETNKTIQSLSMRGLNYKEIDITDESIFLCRKCAKKYFNLKKYGVENISQLESVKEAKRQTCLKNFGVEYPQQNKKIQKKTKSNNLKKYNVTNPAKLEENKKKQVQTKIEKYGRVNLQKESPFCRKEVREKSKQTMIKRYGFENPFANEEIKKKISQNHFMTYLPVIKKRLQQQQVELLDDYKGLRIKDKDIYYNFKCLICNTEFKSSIHSRVPRCPTCFPKFISRAEKEIENFIKTIYSGKIIENDRTVLEGKELDIYLPNKKIAIEFDGLYWHSENQGKNKNYHLNKTKVCNEKGIYLIHIFEDEWSDKQEIVKSRLSHLIGFNKYERIYARKCIIKEISSKQKNIFLNEHHIQGADKSKYKLGLFYNDELVSLMTFGKARIALGSKSEDDVYELIRFASKKNTVVIGGASKLLKYFERNIKWKKIFSFSDKRWSQGAVYKQLGFNFEHTSNPNYWYLENNKRVHRYNFRKNVLNEKLEKFNKNLTEWENMKLNGYNRIWDCGNDKWVKENI